LLSHKNKSLQLLKPEMTCTSILCSYNSDINDVLAL